MTKYLAISLDDEKSKHLASVLSSKTAKKILNLLADKEISESDISKELNLPLNTIEYNLKKLISCGLVEKTKTFFWSTRGKKIPTYKLANKSILISTKQKIKGILPAAVISSLAAIGIKLYFSAKQNAVMKSATFADEAVVAGAKISEATGVIQMAQTNNLWLFFLLGSLTALLIYLILNIWRKNGK